MEKGLFSSLFVITMILLLAPTIIISDQSRYVTDTYNYLNLLTLSADNVVVDAVMDASFSSCALKSSVEYNVQVLDYLTQLINEINSSQKNITCNTQGYSGNLVGSVYSGNVTLICSQDSKYTNVLIEKNLFFQKNISIFFVAPDCTVTISDSLDGGYISAQQTR